MFTDSHAHLTFDTLYENVEEILKRAKDAGVNRIFNICTDIKTAERGIELAAKHDYIHNIGATTPHDVEKEGEEHFPYFEKLAKEGSLVAVGETGLDYYYEHSKKSLQKKFLIKYFHLARETNLPVVIHCRDAFDDLFEIADAEFANSEKALDRGYYVSFSGIATFKKSEGLREAASYVPLDQMLIETDSPYLAPQSKRGKVNEPAYLKETAEMLAILKGVSLEDFAKITSQNASFVFGV
ncbi:hydrolase TatD [Candidatus Aerophobetes bacterium]|uniref:Hydrolase TatD n=1 Tax=Aerophobetes bacterium TaxID=2030807 RepID=A0A2A4YED1_UNCAE|nr:MAG: hydrolase TatD [Candidatus Aerophobetes bacterium]